MAQERRPRNQDKREQSPNRNEDHAPSANFCTQTPRRPYGRALRYVWGRTGVFTNRNLVRYGYAKAERERPNDRYIGVMRAEQAKAKRERLRLWSGRCDTGTPAPTPTPTSAPTPDPPADNNPRFGACAEANRNGYGPYRRGVDPEYAWYQDRDGDGLVCER
ncbi:thermonuclease family protein [Streptosporangium sandarakinum]|uniref:thermonuclease family protein n=1 Tax=Streptosporangium sandarakinum TaxID=1260955 RepID=UPI0036BE3F7A